MNVSERGITSLWRSAENGFTSLWRSAENGFTLIELLVSVAIFAMIAVAGVSILSSSVRGQDIVQGRLSSIADSRRVAALLASDLGQIVARPTRGISGQVEPAFGGGDGKVLITYVRSGKSNPDELNRSGLERVTWRLSGDRLERTVRAQLDGGGDGETAVMIRSLDSAGVRFRSAAGWSKDWRPAKPDDLPRAVELTVQRPGEAPLSIMTLAGDGL